MDVAMQYTPENFRSMVSRYDQRGLLEKWSDCPFHTLMVREKTGGEIPATLEVGRQTVYVASPDQAELSSLLETATVPESEGELFVKSMPLFDLARNAIHQGFLILWAGPRLLIEGTNLHLLADTGIITDDDGNEAVYRSEPLFFEGSMEQPAPPKGSVQHWDRVVLGKEDDSSIKGIEPLYVYDDRHDWHRNPYLPVLPASAVPVSSMSQSAQAFFRRWETPLLGTQEEAPSPTPPEINQGVDGWVPNDWLAGFGRVQEYVDTYLIPPANELYLAIAPYELDDEDTDKVYWDVTLEVSDRFGRLMPYGGMLVSPSRFRANPDLPDELGKHAVSEAFRERLVRQVAWRMFENGRRLGNRFYVDTELFERFFPFKPDNDERWFQPDYNDPRFPCLARFQCGKHDIPVLLQGQVRGNYVCEPLVCISVPESEVPAMMPGRNLLIIDGVMDLMDYAGGVLVPEDLIDFPEPWYRGARASSVQIINDVRRSAYVDRLVTAHSETEEKKASGDQMWEYVFIAIGLMVALFLVMGLA